MVDLKPLVRAGIPDRFRKQVWRQLIQHKTKDIILNKGSHYYRNLCNLLPDSPVSSLPLYHADSTARRNLLYQILQ